MHGPRPSKSPSRSPCRSPPLSVAYAWDSGCSHAPVVWWAWQHNNHTSNWCLLWLSPPPQPPALFASPPPTSPAKNREDDTQQLFVGIGHSQDHRGTATRPRPLHDGASGHLEEPWPDLGGPGPWLPQPLPPPQRRTHHHAPPHPRPPTSPPSSHPPTEPPCKSSSRP